MTTSAPPTIHARDLSCLALQCCIKSGDGTVVYRGQLVEGYADEVARRGAEHVRYCGWRGCVGDTPTLPAPPAGERSWSIVTLAEYLLVPPATAYRALLPLLSKRGADAVFTRDMPARSFDLPGDGSGLSWHDLYLTEDAAAHLAAVFPDGVKARDIVAAGGEAYAGDDIYPLALHFVTHWGGGA